MSGFRIIVNTTAALGSAGRKKAMPVIARQDMVIDGYYPAVPRGLA